MSKKEHRIKRPWEDAYLFATKYCETVNQTVVYLNLATYLSDQNKTFCSVDTIAKNVNLNKKTVILALEHLQRMGAIKCIGKHKFQTKSYTFPDIDIWQEEEKNEKGKLTDFEASLSPEDFKKYQSEKGLKTDGEYLYNENFDTVGSYITKYIASNIPFPYIHKSFPMLTPEEIEKVKKKKQEKESSFLGAKHLEVI